MNPAAFGPVPTGPVVVACSGGPDSVALAHLAVEHGAHVVALAHVDHQLRAGSSEEGEVVARHAATLGVRFCGLTVTVVPGGSLEAAARRARWAALRDAAAGAVVATGHTADDQAETVLMRLARGAGTTGLAAMRPFRDGIWRPLLGWRRTAVRQLCDERGWPTVDDPTNADRRFERNRIRLDVLPLLGERAVPALARLAGLAADDDDLLEMLATGAPVVLRRDGTATVPRAWLAAAHPALGRRALRRAARLVGAPYGPPADRLDEVRAGRTVDLGDGLRGWLEGEMVVVGRSL